jgi:hypothetical protein
MKKLLTLFLLFISLVGYSQTRNIVPNSGHTGNLGTNQHGLWWLNVYTDSLNHILVTNFRLQNNHDSLSTLDEKAYSSLSGKPTLGTAAAQDVGYFDAAGVGHTEAGAHVTAHENAYTHTNIAVTYGWGDHAQAGYLLKTDTANMLTKYARKLNPTFTGLVTLPLLKVTTGAGAGKVLLSDADGDLSYSASAIGASAYHADSYFEPALPTCNNTGYVLSSTDAQVRSWIAPAGGGDMLLGTVQAVTAEKKFTNSKLTILGSSTGKNTFTMDNSSATDYITTIPAVTGTVALGTGTANEITYWSATNTLGTLAVASYPSLTELSYVKGLSSAVQTQIGNKANTDSPTFTGVVTAPNITLPTNGQILLTLPTTNGHATGNVTNAFNSGYSSTAVGDLVYLDVNSTWQKCDKGTSVATYSGLLGIALEVKAAANAVLVALSGSYIYATGFPTLTIGSPAYMDDAGAIIVAQPTTADHAIRMVGWGVTADILFFFPSPDYIIHL